MLVSVRPMADHDLPCVESALPSSDSDVHARRLDDQRGGLATYFVAWLGQQSVGHTLVRWNGTGNIVLSARLSERVRHPYIEGLAVHPDWQSRTIGTQILAAVEREAVRRGHQEIGLAVALDNVRARALYDRLGYRDAGVGVFASDWAHFDDFGRRHVETETCVYLVKCLEAGTSCSPDRTAQVANVHAASEEHP